MRVAQHTAPAQRQCGLILAWRRRGLCSLTEPRRTTSTAPPLPERKEKGYWTRLSHQRQFIEAAGKEFGVKTLSDWYNVSRKQLEDIGGRGLLKRYLSLGGLLRTIYPDFNWDDTRFVHAKILQWKRLENQRAFLDNVAKDFGIHQPTDWHKITRKQILEKGGQSLFLYYPTLAEALNAAFPPYKWDPLEFEQANPPPPKKIENIPHIMSTLARVEEALDIKKPEDWHSVNLSDLKALGFPSSITRMKLAEFLKAKYPDYEWQNIYLLKGRFAQQRRLERAVKILFPEEDILVNARRAADLKSPSTGDYLELDIYIKRLNLAFEFQERHHYANTELDYRPLESYINRDKAKKEMTAIKGITVITVPFWWNGDHSSLVATLRKQRPDLLENWKDVKAEPIPEQIPQDRLAPHIPKIEGLGQPVTASLFTLSSVNPTNWWLFEKYDGVRGFWNPEKKAFYSRLGNEFMLPDMVVSTMPSDLFLDGELWFGRDNFQEALKISNRAQSQLIDWSKFKYMVFDIPNHKGNYKERYEALVSAMKEGKSKYIEVAPKADCKGVEHLEKYFQDVIDKGGEGLILRDPSSALQGGRSAGYLKHKKYRDAEAKVVAKVGPYQWECELPNGVRFIASAGTTEFTKRWDPKQGDIISFKHHGFMLISKKPKFPTLYRMRNDMTWDDVINNWKEQKVKPTALPIRKSGTVYKPKGFWSRMENRRKFLIEFAKEQGFDPMDPLKWRDANRSALLRKEGGASLLTTHEGNFLKVLRKTFPEMTFDFKSRRVDPHYWANAANCRQFFDDYAELKGFDPKIPDNWYLLSLERALRKHRGALSIRQHFGGLRKALKSAYPEVDFAEWKEKTVEKEKKWANLTLCRELFDKVANAHGINPLREEEWYTVPVKQATIKMGGSSLGKYYGGFKNALQAAYPELAFTKWEQKQV